MKEIVAVGGQVGIRLRCPEIPEGYYTVESLRVAIETCLNGFDRLLPGPCVVTHNTLTARFEFTNDATRFNDSCALYTKESLENPKQA